MKYAFQVMKVPAENCVELVEQDLKDEAKSTVRFMLGDGEKYADDIFTVLLDTYGDNVSIGTRLKDFYKRKQMQGETIRSDAYGLQSPGQKKRRHKQSKTQNPFQSS